MLLNTILTKNISKISKSALFRVNPSISRSAATTSNIETVDLAYSIYDDCGKPSTKPPLLILHGLFGLRKGWSGMSKTINQTTGRKVITVDARNHGDSQHSPEHTYLHMTHDVIELLKKLEITKTSILGHSMGGHTAMVLALIRPDLVSSAVIEDISPVRKNHQALQLGNALLNIMTTMSIRSDIPMCEAKELAHEHLRSVTPNISAQNYLLESFVNSNSGFYTWKHNIPVLKEVFQKNIVYFPSNLKGLQYDGPTQFIGGTQSDFIRNSDMPEIRKYFPLAELNFVDGAGHWVHSQKPEKFLEILCKFLIEK